MQLFKVFRVYFSRAVQGAGGNPTTNKNRPKPKDPGRNITAQP